MGCKECSKFCLLLFFDIELTESIAACYHCQEHLASFEELFYQFVIPPLVKQEARQKLGSCTGH